MIGQVVAAVSRLWPFANGSGRILDLFGRNINLGSGQRSVRTSDDVLLQVYADDLIGRHIILSGKFDRSIVDVLVDHARAGDVLVDIGANIGYVATCFLKRVPDSRAICVEPQPGIVDLLRLNTAQFAGRADVHQIALSDKDGELRFHVNSANRGASRISEDGEITVPAIDAGEFLRRFPKVDMIKIDVEGHEAVIFQSIENELKRLRPRGILFECHGQEGGPEGALGAVLNRLGYTIFGIEKNLLSTKLKRVDRAEDCTTNDYIATL